jgi:hypothetical protein
MINCGVMTSLQGFNLWNVVETNVVKGITFDGFLFLVSNLLTIIVGPMYGMHLATIVLSYVSMMQ